MFDGDNFNLCSMLFMDLIKFINLLYYQYYLIKLKDKISKIMKEFILSSIGHFAKNLAKSFPTLVQQNAITYSTEEIGMNWGG
jgi:hypothetical protein